MAADVLPIDGITHAIQLAVAPVFLLSAVATLLGVLTGRLGRAVDRRRHHAGGGQDERSGFSPPGRTCVRYRCRARALAA
jgi:hypothetical protein